VHRPDLRMWPLDAEGRVVPAYAARSFRGIRLRDHVQHFRVVRECLESVGEAFRDIESVAAIGIELAPEPLRVCRGVRPQVDDDVENSAARTTNNLRFLMRRCLEVHSAKRTRVRVARDAALSELRVESVLRELVSTPRPREEAALIRMEFNLD